LAGFGDAPAAVAAALPLFTCCICVPMDRKELYFAPNGMSWDLEGKRDSHYGYPVLNCCYLCNK
jgi:hypothetical protein